MAATSSDSGSMDGSNSDEGNGDDSSLASARKSPIDIENVCSSDTGVPSCKQARRRRHVCDPTSEKTKQITEEDVNMINSKADIKAKDLIYAIAETNISELYGAENEGSYSSPISNKSENLDGFDVDDIYADEIAQLCIAQQNQRRIAQNTMPPAFAAAAAAMAAAHTAMSMQKTEANVAAALH
ncbi:Ubiquitin carboxyl-terminal hydrolase puf [Eumeta japonica]|uniref:Ubiquitin carboxyl-terminal hydrolase puf n=1 Tax=Eumeta variegata TaxID=151549 RepID=A0A4C1SWE6_EUMVA|nr:Ubiquitin carboxyl-terminal hydrolase puf [Eumeta japonica]